MLRLGCGAFGAKLASPAAAAASSCAGTAFWTPIRVSVWRRRISRASTNSASMCELGHLLQVEHHRRVQEKSRTALDLLGELVLEGGIAQHARAHHHHGEDRALHQIARHPRTDTADKTLTVHGLTPNRPPRNGFRRRYSGSLPEAVRSG